MKTRPLGRSGLELTVVGYGAWEASSHWGPFAEDGVVAAIRAAVDAGINWVDTAEVYGPHTSEEVVGKALAGRDEVIVATKVAPKPAGTGFAAGDVRRACEASLRRLGRDVIDLFQLHWPDGRVEVEETWTAMASLVDDGLVRAIGVSNFDKTLIERCEQIRHVDSLQPHVSMLVRENLDLARWCGANDTGVVAYSPLACGLLTGTITKETSFDDEDWRGGKRGFTMYDELFGPNLDGNLATVSRLRPIAETLGVPLADLAIAWVLDQPGLTSAIVGSRNPEHVRQNVDATNLVFGDATRAEIESALKG